MILKVSPKLEDAVLRKILLGGATPKPQLVEQYDVVRVRKL